MASKVKGYKGHGLGQHYKTLGVLWCFRDGSLPRGVPKTLLGAPWRPRIRKWSLGGCEGEPEGAPRGSRGAPRSLKGGPNTRRRSSLPTGLPTSRARTRKHRSQHMNRYVVVCLFLPPTSMMNLENCASCAASSSVAPSGPAHASASLNNWQQVARTEQ